MDNDFRLDEAHDHGYAVIGPGNDSVVIGLVPGSSAGRTFPGWPGPTTRNRLIPWEICADRL
ncbi:hypothetical protein [Arthrobacter methylotrophus]|uniref:hypothetical protein n=1 Tax=Arthrobacter methylotrophus TaxID=121291 RepID=UPI0031EFE99A